MQAGATSTPKPVHRVVDPERFVIAVLDLEAGRLTAADKTCLAAARQIAGLDPGTAVIALSDSDAVGLPEAGADRYEVIPGLRASDGRFAVEAALCSLSIQMTCRAFVFSDTALGRHTARSLAAELGVTPAIGAHDIGSNYCVTRCQSGESDAVHEGLMVLTAKEGFVPPVLSMSFEAAPFQSGVSLAPAESSLVDLGPEFSPADDVALEEAPFVLCGGGGVRDWQLFNDLAVALNATRAGSRVVCDAGHLPRDRQVGASGRSSSAKVYLALGLSGAVQHLQGIENCEEVLAVNTDAAAPIIKRADTSYIADADEVMSEMLRQLVAPE
ncbi:electron transfer flavoprotein subunit alpha/FixB family protein [Pseudohaliea sp.]|uniref:electron transfer flavoprotein subunit alpha/FixB family protein n=1 Tax=Pseudohaliea sp. TaxID=2740289 RepID=UPI0032EE3CED